MSKIKIITGSQASLTKQLSEQFNITVIPYYLNYREGKSLKEGIDFETEDFYKSLYDIDNLPTSSPPSVGDIINVITSLRKDYDKFIIFTLSKNYSQMYNTCEQAIKEIKDVEIHLIDSGGATSYQAMMCVMSAEMIKQGKSMDEIFAFVNNFKNLGDDFSVMDTLKYLAKGGRMSKAKAFMGSLLSIKPVIGHRDGFVTAITKVRTNKQALDFILSEIGNRLKNYPNSKINIMLQGIFVDDWLKDCENSIRSNFDVENLWYTRLSAITSIHYGPKSWSVTYCIIQNNV
jgi:DegV family protein with EDD domain